MSIETIFHRCHECRRLFLPVDMSDDNCIYCEAKKRAAARVDLAEKNRALHAKVAELQEALKKYEPETL